MGARSPNLVVAAAQPATVPGDVGANVAAHVVVVQEAGARVVAFPELSLTGYLLDAPPIAPDDPVLDPLVAACGELDAIALVGAPVTGEAGDHLATVLVDGDGARVVYRKVWLGGDEPGRFTSGTETGVIEVDGWRIGLGICKDTGVAEHAAAVAACGVDLYVAGVTHRPDELQEQERRARRIAGTIGAPVVLASSAGPTGPGYERTAGCSSIWSAAGEALARADDRAGSWVRAELALDAAGPPPA